MSINWGGSVDELVASWARPFGIYLGSVTLCACCFIPATATETIPFVAGIVGGAAALRSWDKKTAANATTPQPTSVGRTG